MALGKAVEEWLKSLCPYQPSGIQVNLLDSPGFELAKPGFCSRLGSNPADDSESLEIIQYLLHTVCFSAVLIRTMKEAEQAGKCDSAQSF